MVAFPFIEVCESDDRTSVKTPVNYFQPVVYVLLFINRWTFWKPKFSVKDANGEVVLTVDGPCCTCSCGSDVDFEVDYNIHYNSFCNLLLKQKSTV